MRCELCVISKIWEKMLESFVAGAGRKVGPVELWVLRKVLYWVWLKWRSFSHSSSHTILCFALVDRKVLKVHTWPYALHSMCLERQGDCKLHPEKCQLHGAKSGGFYCTNWATWMCRSGSPPQFLPLLAKAYPCRGWFVSAWAKVGWPALHRCLSSLTFSKGTLIRFGQVNLVPQCSWDECHHQKLSLLCLGHNLSTANLTTVPCGMLFTVPGLLCRHLKGSLADE